MRIAHIIPPQWESCLGQGSYRMTYVPWVLEDPGYVKELKAKESYIILDHGLFENDLSLPDFTTMAQAVSILGPDEVVLPDVLGDSKGTLMAATAVLPLVPLNTRVMFVPQARTMEDWKRCLRAFMYATAHLNIRDPVVGLSSLRRTSGLRAQIGTRILMMKYLHGRGFEVHLLGLCSVKHFFEEELPAALQFGVRGVDTCAAFALGARGLKLGKDSPRLFLGDVEKYDSLPPGAVDLIRENIQTLNKELEKWR